jgi:LysR family transcriptional regulator, nod-box dependent transcriptional activator
MRFKRLDLNLLVALDVLLEKRSVSQSAARMNLSQPAMSSALARLRGYFGDDLLVADGKRLYPTPYAELLLPKVRDCLGRLDALVSSPSNFDPTTSHRRFSIICSDYIAASLFVPLIARLAEQAPHIVLELQSVSDDSAAQLDRGKADLLITLEEYVHPDHPAELLFEEHQVVAGWRENPLFSHPLSEADVMACGHVTVAVGRTATASFADRQLAIMGKSRRIEVTTGSFLAVPWILSGTQRLAFMHERLARTVAKTFPIAYVPVPFDFPSMREFAQHHRARDADAGLQWLRRRLIEVSALP